MGKRRRFSPEGSGYKLPHGVSIDDIEKLQRLAARHLLRELGKEIRGQPVISDVIHLPHRFVSPRGIIVELDSRSEFISDSRPELIQTLGEQMLQAELET